MIYTIITLAVLWTFYLSYLIHKRNKTIEYTVKENERLANKTRLYDMLVSSNDFWEKKYTKEKNTTNFIQPLLYIKEKEHQEKNELLDMYIERDFEKYFKPKKK